MDVLPTREELERVLSSLLGLPFWSLGRAAATQWFIFGDKQCLPQANGRTRIVGTYSLHVGCVWRIVGPSGVFTSSEDRYVPVDRPLEWDDEFDWYKGPNLGDYRVKNLEDELSKSPLYVTGAQADEVGGFKLNLDSKLVLEIFPASSIPGEEQWRLFRPGDVDSHFVLKVPEKG